MKSACVGDLSIIEQQVCSTGDNAYRL